MKKSIVFTMSAIAATLFVTGCSTDSDVASRNLSKAAEMFQIERRVVFFNGITDTYLLSIEGLCSIDDQGNQLEVTCKTSDTNFKKHFLGLSDNVSYFVEQLESSQVSTYRYKVIFKPSVILPDVDISAGS